MKYIFHSVVFLFFRSTNNYARFMRLLLIPIETDSCTCRNAFDVMKISFAKWKIVFHSNKRSRFRPLSPSAVWTGREEAMFKTYNYDSNNTFGRYRLKLWNISRIILNVLFFSNGRSKRSTIFGRVPRPQNGRGMGASWFGARTKSVVPWKRSHCKTIVRYSNALQATI